MSRLSIKLLPSREKSENVFYSGEKLWMQKDSDRGGGLNPELAPSQQPGRAPLWEAASVLLYAR
ncbi:hypothetical protein EYF80_004809 [Liparis tanakae]|uniref:Uncharacterized protein n=1 Tax=Liparis tanakae TaxID=230148 RepID=A0A4Z2J4E6_9TELE|nr:hypothetical protein EYF80_004809 [Liparis tanakae]